MKYKARLEAKWLPSFLQAPLGLHLAFQTGLQAQLGLHLASPKLSQSLPRASPELPQSQNLPKASPKTTQTTSKPPPKPKPPQTLPKDYPNYPPDAIRIGARRRMASGETFGVPKRCPKQVDRFLIRFSRFFEVVCQATFWSLFAICSFFVVFSLSEIDFSFDSLAK